MRPIFITRVIMKTKLIVIITLFYAGLACPMAVKLRKKEIDMYRDKALACTIQDSEIEKARAVIAQLKRDDIRIGNPAERNFEEALKKCLKTRSVQARPAIVQTEPIPTPKKPPSKPKDTPAITKPKDKTPKKDIEKKEKEEFDTFEDLANAIETALAGIDSLTEQIPGIQNIQSKKENIAEIQNKITDLKVLLDLLKKKSCGGTQKHIRNKIKNRYNAAKDAVNALVATESQEDAKYTQEQQELAENNE